MRNLCVYCIKRSLFVPTTKLNAQLQLVAMRPPTERLSVRLCTCVVVARLAVGLYPLALAVGFQERY